MSVSKMDGRWCGGGNGIRMAIAGWLTAVGLATHAARAELIEYSVNMNTSALAAVPGNYALWFMLTDGDGIANTSVMIDNFKFGGGAGPAGPITLSEDGVNFFFDSVDPFTPGGTLGFDLHVTSTATGLPTPDLFSFSILDLGADLLDPIDDVELPSDSPFGVGFVDMELGGGLTPGVPVTYESFGAPLVTDTSAVPMPLPGVALAGLALLAPLGLARGRQRGRAAAAAAV